MDPFKHFSIAVDRQLSVLQASGALPSDIAWKNVTVEAPRDPTHGDITTNAAMVLAKPAKMKPREIADKLKELLEQLDDVADAQVAGPGFINLTLTDEFWRGQLVNILKQANNFGRLAIGDNQRVNVEYVSANPTGPMHVGHCRGAVFGDALANLLAAAGFKVTREYYINDAGAQVDVLAKSAFIRYREALGEDIGEIPQGFYPGDYLKPVGRALADSHGDALRGKDEAEWLPIVRDVSITMMMEMIRQDLSALDIVHDVFFSERDLLEGANELDQTVADLKAKGLIFEGVLEPPKGKAPEDWEPREQTLFKATNFGDDTDRPIRKSDGSYTYFASDIAYHRNKVERGFESLIDVWGADHSGYVKRMQAAVAAITDQRADLDVKICQLVRLLRDGQPVKMSKRAGTMVTLREVVDEVGPDVVRFMMLYRKNDAPLDFDFARVTEQSKDNPVFYVQYAHARVHSVFRMAAEKAPNKKIELEKLLEADFALLKDPSELSLIKRMAAFPKLIEGAALSHEPHRVAFYLYDLASDFHALWNKGNDDPALRFVIAEQEALTLARLGLIRAAGLVIALGLNILGVTPVKEMR
jgi:arginyl-tRNA synthetase